MAMCSRTLSHLLRFFAHLVLVMRLFKQPVPDYAATRILEAYVKVLEATNQVRPGLCDRLGVLFTYEGTTVT